MSRFLDVALLLGLIVCNGIFALSEIALVTSRRARLKTMQEQGQIGAKKAQRLNADPTRALSTIQVGITSIGVLSGIVGESALAKPVADTLIVWGVSPDTANALGIVLVVVFVTYASIVLGELVPKRIAQTRPEELACRVARMIDVLSHVAAPFVRLLTVSTEWILQRLKINNVKGSVITEEEIHRVLSEGTAMGVIETNESEMVKNVFRLDDRQVTSLMTPRSEIEWLDVEDSIRVNLQKIRRSKRSRMPICRSSLENVLGICSVRMLLQQNLEGKNFDLTQAQTEVVYVPESLSGLELLESFRKNDTTIALVVDEYGEVQGLVTPRDLLEAIAGEFKPERPDDAWVTRQEDGSLLLDGFIPVPELKDALQIRNVPDEKSGRYSTLAGMLMFLLGRLPQEGDVIIWHGWRFLIVDMDERRIDKVLVTREGIKK